MIASDPIRVVLRVVAALEALGVSYLVGGSIVSSYFGLYRPTQDVDLVAHLEQDDVDAFVQALAGEFYVDETMIREAIRRRGCFNVIFLETMDKADIFIPELSRWAEEEFRRRRREYPDPQQPERSVYFASPEDTILHKLCWFEMGGRVSDRQWQDVLGVLKVQGMTLDHRYLQEWAARLNLTELLQQATQEAGLDLLLLSGKHGESA